MTRVFDEGKLRFQFGPSWTVEKYDDHRDFLQKIRTLQGTKAVDFVSVLGEADIYLIEVKDLRGHRIENKARISDGQLALEVALKVRDTLSGLIGASRTSSEPEVWDTSVEALLDRRRALRVVLWLEEDPTRQQAMVQRAQMSVLVDLLKKRLRWLTTKVFVLNQATHRAALPDMTVRSLPTSEGPGNVHEAR